MRFAVALLLLTTTLAGCFGGPSAPFEWPAVTTHACDNAQGEVGCRTVWNGFTNPVYGVVIPDGTGDLAIVDQVGLVWRMHEETLGLDPMFDLRTEISTCHFEQGLLGLAFDGDAAYVTFTEDKPCDPLIERKGEKGDVILARMVEGEPQELLRIDEPYRNHNGGMIQFGPDGALWMSVGDGGDHGDPENTGQDGTDLLGSILRLDVSGDKAVAFESDEDPNLDDRVWSYGLRNPWRFAFDGDDVWIADVGQTCFEEVNLVPIEGRYNFGWSKAEGPALFESSFQACDEMTVADELPGEAPVWYYDHSQGACSITGGVVVPDDSPYESLRGHYLVGDFCTGTIWALHKDDPSNARVILQSSAQITSFALGADGTIYLMQWGSSEMPGSLLALTP